MILEEGLECFLGKSLCENSPKFQKWAKTETGEFSTAPDLVLKLLSRVRQELTGPAKCLHQSPVFCVCACFKCLKVGDTEDAIKHGLHDTKG